MIYKKRDSWCFRDDKNKLHKFKTKVEAEAFLKVDEPVEVVEVEEFKAPTKLQGFYKNI